MLFRGFLAIRKADLRIAQNRYGIAFSAFCRLLPSVAARSAPQLSTAVPSVAWSGCWALSFAMLARSDARSASSSASVAARSASYSLPHKGPTRQSSHAGERTQ